MDLCKLLINIFSSIKLWINTFLKITEKKKKIKKKKKKLIFFFFFFGLLIFYFRNEVIKWILYPVNVKRDEPNKKIGTQNKLPIFQHRVSLEIATVTQPFTTHPLHHRHPFCNIKSVFFLFFFYFFFIFLFFYICWKKIIKMAT